MSMNGIMDELQKIENQIERALWTFEMQGRIDKALEIYQQAEANLVDLSITTADAAYSEQQRVIAYCLMRQGNIFRQREEHREALDLSEREIAAARASKDEIMLARSLMSNGTNRLVTGEIERGLELLEESRALFERGESYDHQQGTGWYWILQADLGNAGIIEMEPGEVLEIAERILATLEPIENWVGVARAYAARATANDRIGDQEEAAEDRKQQAYYESIVEG
jgi:tetratricopeptide (TPR) repeat protein